MVYLKKEDKEYIERLEKASKTRKAARQGLKEGEEAMKSANDINTQSMKRV